MRLLHLRLLHCLWFVGALLCNAMIHAQTLLEQRQAFITAERALQQQQRVDRETLETLTTYPLYPYLRYQQLLNAIRTISSQEINNFITTYSDSPLARRLHTTWLNQLAQQQRWNDFIASYQTHLNRADYSLEQQCGYRQALLHNKQLDQALADMTALWLRGSSLPTACDAVLDQWRQRGGLTTDLIWQRFRLAIERGETVLANYLSRQLPLAERNKAMTWLAIDNQPTLITDTQRIDPKWPQAADMVLHGVRQWLRRDSVAAATALDAIKSRYQFDPDALAAVEQQIALFLASRDHPSALMRFNALPASAVNEAVREWRVRVPLKRGQWPFVLQAIQQMPTEEREKPLWRYWQARALETTGQGEAARRLYASLAPLRDYHGFLAAQRINKPYSFNHQPVLENNHLQKELANRPPVLRAQELYILNRQNDARAEWQFGIADLAAEKWQQAALLAYQWGWWSEAIRLLANSGVWDDLTVRFPMPYQTHVKASAQQHQIEPAWIYAIMRQESLFRQDARSPVGALGLMQIMPATAQRIAQQLNDTAPNTAQLISAETNIRYGSYYLRYTRDQLQNHPLLATAAYNAGPHRVKQWLPTEEMAADRFAETIPFFETRAYVKRVIEYTVVYAHQLGSTNSALTAILADFMRPILPDNVTALESESD